MNIRPEREQELMHANNVYLLRARASEDLLRKILEVTTSLDVVEMIQPFLAEPFLGRDFEIEVEYRVFIDEEFYAGTNSFKEALNYYALAKRDTDETDKVELRLVVSSGTELKPDDPLRP